MACREVEAYHLHPRREGVEGHFIVTLEGQGCGIGQGCVPSANGFTRGVTRAKGVNVQHHLHALEVLGGDAPERLHLLPAPPKASELPEDPLESRLGLAGVADLKGRG